MWRIDQRMLLLPILIYCYAPTFIFLLGWVKIIYAAPSCVILGYLLFMFYKSTQRQEREGTITIQWEVAVIISVLLLAMCICCGYGGFVNQAYDWFKHNAILQDLYTHDWPVQYEVDGHSALLTYYHALYLFPALLGKLLQSAQLVEISFGCVCFIGLWLFTFSLLLLAKADRWYKQLLIVLIFLFFSGMLFPLQKFSHLLTGLPYCNNWHAYPIGNHLLQYRSVFVMLRWVGPQCFIAWLCVVLFCQYKNFYSFYSIILLPVLLSGTWAFLGIVAIAVYYAIVSSAIQRKFCWNLFSWRNLIPAIMPGLIFLLYLTGNVAIRGDGLNNHKTGMTLYHGLEFFWLFMFLLFIYGIIIIIVWHGSKKDVLFYSIPLSLCTIPFFSIGSETDFVMGVSIPAITFLIIYSSRFIVQYKSLLLRSLLLLCIIAGAQYPYAELKSVVVSNSWHCGNDYENQTMESCFKPEGKDGNIQWGNYIANNLDENLYYNFFIEVSVK